MQLKLMILGSDSELCLESALWYQGETPDTLTTTVFHFQHRIQ